jgi:glycosyltransferase involved in cell wall biosynthesis
MPNVKTVPTISIVVPFHNEEPNVIELYGRLKVSWRSLAALTSSSSSMMASRDLTYKLLKELAEIDPHVVAVRLRRNFGQTAALAAGLRIAMANT